jgi:anti-sigma factor RsiW
VTTPGPCPSAQQIAAFLEGSLSPTEREAISRHVDGCAACFDLLATVGVQTAQPLPSVDDVLRGAAIATQAHGQRLRRILPGLSAAAAILVAVVWWKAPSHESPVLPAAAPAAATPAASGTRSENAGPILAVDEPRDGDTIDGQPLVRWQGPRDAASYEVLLTTAAGDVILKRQVPGGDHQLRLDVPDHRGELCYLWVAAYLPEGRRLTSNVVKVTIGK